MSIGEIEDYIVRHRAYWESQGYTEDEAAEAAARDFNDGEPD